MGGRFNSPGPSGLKDPALGRNCGSDLISVLGAPYAPPPPKKIVLCKVSLSSLPNVGKESNETISLVLCSLYCCR